MFKKICIGIAFVIACISALTSFADNIPPPASPLNYKILTVSLPPNLRVSPNQILVLDFFSYGCPHCLHLSSALEKWLKINANTVAYSNDAQRNKARIIFRGVPIAWFSAWEYDQKAFEIAHLLKKEATFNPIFFGIAQNPLLGIASDDQLRSIFSHHGVDTASFDKVLNSTELKQAIATDNDLAKYFKIVEIPAIIIVKDGKLYYISNLTIKPVTPEQFIMTLSQLTHTKNS